MEKELFPVDSAAIVIVEELPQKVAEEEFTQIEQNDDAPSLDIKNAAWKGNGVVTDRSTAQKIWFVVWVFIRICLVLAMLYLFVCSLDVLQDSFQMLGGRAAGEALQNSELLNNPISGLILGVLVTVLVQSSSTSTSITVSMVASRILSVRQAIPIIMGANIGTSVTSTIVALTQSSDREMFRKSFSGATVHDMFNWSTVIILLPIEIASGFLYHMTSAVVKNIQQSSTEDQKFLKVITEPLTNRIVDIDRSVITAIAEDTDNKKFPLCKYYCSSTTVTRHQCFNDGINQTFVDDIASQPFTTDIREINGTGVNCSYALTWKDIDSNSSTKCTHLMTGVGLPDNPLSEAAGGVILLLLSLLVMIICLLILVKILSSLLQGPTAKIVHKVINSDFPGVFRHLTGYVVMVVGAGLTMLVQSSSVFTASVTPLVGLGVITVERVYPLHLGSNIGTTLTSIIAALTADADRVADTMQIAMCHLFFNIFGILLFYPVPITRKVPLSLAKKLGDTTAKYRWFAVFYLLGAFFIFPALILGLSIAGIYVLIGVGAPLLTLIILVAITNCCQTKCPHRLPAFLQNWSFLPKALRSFQPYDRVITICCANPTCRKVCKCCNQTETESEPQVVVNGQLNHPVNDGKIAIVSADTRTNGFINEGFYDEVSRL